MILSEADLKIIARMTIARELFVVDLIETARAFRELVELYHEYCEWPDCSECKRAAELLAGKK